MRHFAAAPCRRANQPAMSPLIAGGRLCFKLLRAARASLD
jgi:hypothetical protein